MSPIKTIKLMIADTINVATHGTFADSLIIAACVGISALRPIANRTRDSPRIKFNNTPSIAVIAPIANTVLTPGTPNPLAITWSGAALPNEEDLDTTFTMPSVFCWFAKATTNPTETYNTIETNNVTMIARGMFRRGLSTVSYTHLTLPTKA